MTADPRYERPAAAGDGRPAGHRGWGALAQNMGVFLTLGTLSAGSALTAAGFYAGSLGTVRAGGWLFVISAAAAWLTAGAMVLEHSFGRTIIPLGKRSARAGLPGARA